MKKEQMHTSTAPSKKLKKPKAKKEKKELNELGFPLDDPYGLAEAFWTIFTKPKKETTK
tara:strand:- start:90 stop:266 length:177 start_codon:yes stop_codon:yes gene_type:complete